MTRAFLAEADALLRGRAPGADRLRGSWLEALIFIVVCGCAYGALMGTSGGVTGDRLFQVLYSAAKVPLLLVVTFFVCLPSFFVLNTLLGVRADFPAVLHALISTQAALTIVLLACAPYTLLWYASFIDHTAAILFNAVIFGVASLAAQWFLRGRYLPLIARHPRHRTLLRAWIFLYAFVGIQTAWLLRPFLGNPLLPVEFFRAGAWTNAYVALAGMIRDTLFR